MASIFKEHPHLITTRDLGVTIGNTISVCAHVSGAQRKLQQHTKHGNIKSILPTNSYSTTLASEAPT